MTTHAPELRARRFRAWVFVVAIVGVATPLAAAVGGYAAGGGFTSESHAGQDVSERVMNAWATGDPASVKATYDPTVKVLLVYGGTQDVIASSVDEVAAAIDGAKAFGNTYRQVGPVASYTAANGDVYVSSIVEVRGLAHATGDPLVGFYRVRDGKVIRHVFLDAAHY